MRDDPRTQSTTRRSHCNSHCSRTRCCLYIRFYEQRTLLLSAGCRRAQVITRVRTAAAVVLIALLPSACGGDALRVTNAVYLIPASDGPAVVYFTIRNPGATADTLISISSPALSGLSLHETTQMGSGLSAMTHMSPLSRVAVPASGDLTFAPGGYHAMATGTGSPIVRGDSLALTLTFAKHAPVTVTARVLTYADYDPRAAGQKH